MAERLSTGFIDAVNATGDVKTVMANGIIRGFVGTQPADADYAETGDMIIEFTLDGGAFEAGVSTNGLNMGTTSGGVLSKSASETWKGAGNSTAGATGKTLGWLRWYDNNVTTGASTTAIRVDMAVGDNSAFEAVGANRTIVENVDAIISSFTYTPKRS